METSIHPADRGAERRNVRSTERWGALPRDPPIYDSLGLHRVYTVYQVRVDGKPDPSLPYFVTLLEYRIGPLGGELYKSFCHFLVFLVYTRAYQNRFQHHVLGQASGKQTIPYLVLSPNDSPIQTQ